jgi:hypothetical protein
MKHLLFCFLFLGCWIFRSAGQIPVHDQSIIYQQERMVFKQWDSNDFTPKPGFLYTNPLYWMTWAWYPDYKNTDLRPLGPGGPQTQRLALVAAMQNTDNAYKREADTLRNTSLSEALNYSALFSDSEPLWLLYYSKAFQPLLNQQDGHLLDGLSAAVKNYLISSGAWAWYLDESHSLSERLRAARSTVLDRGSRILTYYRLLAEYRNLSATWETRKQQAGNFLRLARKTGQIKHYTAAIPTIPTGRSDQQLADDILNTAKF